MKYYLFLDETGDHGLSYIDDNFPLFLLSGVFISEEEYSILRKEINDFKNKFFKTTEVILHSRDIRKVEGPFQILFNLEIKKHFYEDINRILGNTNYKIFGAGIDKRKHIEKYGKTAHDPYSTSLSFLIERLIFECDDTDRCSEVNIVIEKRGKREDALLLAHYNTIIDGAGTFYVSA